MIAFDRHFSIGPRQVGGGAPALLIAEAGVNHFGDMGLARDLVDLAADGGADVFKTQVFDVERLIASRAADWRERLRPRSLTLDQCVELAERCRHRGLVFMTTAHDESRIEWLRELDVAAIKVGSGERRNPGFVTALAALGRPMIVSTGMYTEADVRQALDACAAGGCRQVALLHCVTCYPASDGDLNLRAMEALGRVADVPIGWSDHTEDFVAVYAAAAMGAAIIEKHITILRNVPNAQDWKVSAGPDDLAEMVRTIRRIEAMRGAPEKVPVAAEATGMSWATKSLVAARALPRGTALDASDLLAKRPGDGIAPDRLTDLLGRRLRRDLGPDDPVRWEDLESL